MNDPDNALVGLGGDSGNPPRIIIIEHDPAEIEKEARRGPLERWLGDRYRHIKTLDEVARFAIHVPRAVLTAWAQMAIERRFPDNVRAHVKINPAWAEGSSMLELGFSLSEESTDLLKTILKTVAEAAEIFVRTSGMGKEDAEKIRKILEKAAEGLSSTQEGVRNTVYTINNELAGLLHINFRGLEVDEPPPPYRRESNVIVTDMRFGEKLLNRIAPTPEPGHEPSAPHLIPFALVLGLLAGMLHLADRQINHRREERQQYHDYRVEQEEVGLWGKIKHGFGMAMDNVKRYGLKAAKWCVGGLAVVCGGIGVATTVNDTWRERNNAKREHEAYMEEHMRQRAEEHEVEGTVIVGSAVRETGAGDPLVRGRDETGTGVERTTP